MDGLKPVIWVGASKKELKAFPRAVQREKNIDLINQRLTQVKRIWQEMNQ